MQCRNLAMRCPLKMASMIPKIGTQRDLPGAVQNSQKFQPMIEWQGPF